MKIASFIKATNKFGVETLAVLVSFAIAQGIVTFFYRNHEHTVVLTVESFLNKNEFSGNPYKTAQAIESLENIGIIQCTKLTSLSDGIVFFDSQVNSPCSRNSLLNTHLNIKVDSLNGQPWLIDSQAKINFATSVLLWALRISAAFLGLALIKIFKWRIRLVTHKKDLEIARSEAISGVAKQVAHDIRSPLSALNIAVAKGYELSEGKVLIEGAIQRINDIANDLLSKSIEHVSVDSNQSPAPQSTNPSELIMEVVAEKTLQYSQKPKVQIKTDLSGPVDVVVNIAKTDLYRVLSNLINNSVEAFSESHQSGIIVVGFRHYQDRTTIFIQDDGCGIPAEVLRNLGQSQISHGKDIRTSGSGSGLGLFHARQTVEYHKGELRIQSRVDVGTLVEIVLPNLNSSHS